MLSTQFSKKKMGRKIFFISNFLARSSPNIPLFVKNDSKLSVTPPPPNEKIDGITSEQKFESPQTVIFITQGEKIKKIYSHL